MIALALVLQVGAATVGDTMWVTRTIDVAPQQTVQPVEWVPEDPVEALGTPEIRPRSGRVDIRYPLTVWRAGRQRIEIPGPVVLGPGGTVDSLAPYVVTLDVASVLPDVPADSAIPPQPTAAVVRQQVTSPWPLVVLLVLAAVIVLPVAWGWRRRGPAAVWPPRCDTPPLFMPVERWADAGERRVAASAAAARLRDLIAARGAEEATSNPAGRAELDELLHVLDTARFGTDTEVDVLALVQRAAQLEHRLAVPSA